MPAKVRVTTVILLLLLLVVLVQGCSNSSSVDSADDGQSLSLRLESSSGATTLIADGTSMLLLQMTVATQEGEPVVNTPVVFSTDAGTLEAVPDTNVITTQKNRSITHQALPTSRLTVTTDSNGIALVQLRSSTTVTTATITAEVEGFRQTFTITFISSIPTDVALTAQPSAVGVGGTSTIVATVTDIDNEPVAGITVIFGLTASNSDGATLSNTTDITDSKGQAATTYTAGSTVGTDTIQVQLTSNTSATANTLSTSTEVVVQEAGSPAASSLDLLVSSPQLNSDGSKTVTLTALARDSNNNLVSNVDVTFSTEDSAAIQVIRGTTDATGTAEALLTTGGDPSNRTITVRANVGTTLSSTNTVVVSGTTVTVSGTNTIISGESITLSLLLRNSVGKGIANQEIVVNSIQHSDACPDPAVTSTSDLILTEEGIVTTDSNGQAEIGITKMAPPNVYELQVLALGAQDSLCLNVSTEQFKLRMVDNKTEVNLFDDDPMTDDDVGKVELMWDPNRPVDFFITRGTLKTDDPDIPTDEGASITVRTDDVIGKATIFATSDSAGSAVITAADADDPDGPSSQLDIEFVATTAHSLILQASPTTLSANLGGSTDQQSIVTAIVRDPDNNLVKNKTVSFNLLDVSGGRISPAFATTDSFGRASTVYIAGPTPSAQDGVIIDAEVNTDPSDTPCNRDATDKPTSGPCDRVSLTVAKQAFSITLGNGNDIVESNSTQFQMPFAVLVTDANSNPVANTLVELNLIALQYFTGFFFQIFNPDDDTFEEWGQQINDRCTNEDLVTGDLNKDRNGILDAGEDFNNNGILDPGNVASVPASVTTDANGFVEFHVEYPQNHNAWFEVELEARATVTGSEASTTTVFVLEGPASDFESEPPPPGTTSPFGTGACK